jgi:hypothetical protein
MVIIMTATNIKHRSKQQHSHGQPIVDQMYDKTPNEKNEGTKRNFPYPVLARAGNFKLKLSSNMLTSCERNWQLSRSLR